MRISGPFCLVVLSLFGLVCGRADAAETVIGSSQAVLCYRNAEAGSSDSHDCDDALKDEIMTQHDRASTLVNRGIIENTARRFDAAIADFNAALAITPALAEAFLNRGNSRFLQGQMNEALADYTRAIDLKIDRMSAAYYNRALVYGAMGRLKEAQADLQMAIAIDPGFKEAQSELAVVNQLMARPAQPPPPAKGGTG